MTVSKLPPKPNFSALEATAPESAGHRTNVLALIGNLIFNWSNNESLFIYVLMLLLSTDEASAALVFATLNTTRARLDLIQRLARIKIRDPALDRELNKLIERFNDTTQVRNELTHCMYTVDESGEIVQTQSMRVVQTRASLAFGETRPVDEARLKALSDTVRAMIRINRDVWEFLPKLEAHLQQ
ncbi:hypothetical protein JJC00_16420 [Bradyrhizobium diazoefficiens]|uniref:hypothetical protein n=1 Tax=Bradyrhizobium diazoefficiens TaxID=1355477 RepID=UPI00190BC751|nr:hypothetical protein [Bradyrhizobium diazoefficiens]QQO37038.1 hypothetical protein JJC00_16420 [Bradyrhizobium diazoefficiens]